uniref:Uncharacterized protein n=1 Tax=Oryza glumipatula TaxID=40148 RepID=A0A0E0BDI1_9ORYZ
MGGARDHGSTPLRSSPPPTGTPRLSRVSEARGEDGEEVDERRPEVEHPRGRACATTTSTNDASPARRCTERSVDGSGLLGRV